jgi:LuxR family transcriptional regulator, maltose regulon positive regulatory protein
MPRSAYRTTPKILYGRIYTEDDYTGTLVGSPAWFAWLDTATTFYYEGREGVFTAHCERRQRGGFYWIAYRRRAGVLRRCHLGKAHQLTLERLQTVAGTLNTSPRLP